MDDAPARQVAEHRPHQRRHEVGRALRFAGVAAVVWYAVLVGVGFLVGGPLKGVLSGEDTIDQRFEAARTPLWNDLTHWMSWVGNTGSIVLTALVLGLVLRFAIGRWLEPVVLWAGVALQSAVFLLTTLVVSRARPDVEKLDPAPPTSSFPSGHTGASTALYVGLALVLAGRIERRGLRVVVVTLLSLVPLAVGLSRLYRGMHHPTDVVFGVLNGLATVAIVRAATYRGLEDARR